MATRYAVTINGRTFIRQGTRAVVASGMAAVKFNPHHDSRGRFASGSGGSGHLAPSDWKAPTDKVSQYYTGDKYPDEPRMIVPSYLDRQYSGWAESLNAEQKDSLRYYQERGYNAVNGHLRGYDTAMTDAERGQIERHVANIDAAMENARLPCNMTAYRATDLTKTPEVGATFHDNGYTSTTVSSTIGNAIATSANQDYLLRIHIPAGHRAAYIDAFHSKEEYELLLPRRTHYRITGRETRRVRATQRGEGAVERDLTIITIEAIGS